MQMSSVSRQGELLLCLIICVCVCKRVCVCNRERELAYQLTIPHTQCSCCCCYAKQQGILGFAVTAHFGFFFNSFCMKAAERQPFPLSCLPTFPLPLQHTDTHIYTVKAHSHVYTVTHTQLSLSLVLMGTGPGPVTNPPLIAAVTGLVDKRQQSSGHHGKSSATILSAE